MTYSEIYQAKAAQICAAQNPLEAAADYVLDELAKNEAFPDFPFLIDATLAEVVLDDVAPYCAGLDIERAAQLAVENMLCAMDGAIESAASAQYERDFY